MTRVDDPIKARRFDFSPVEYLEGISDLDNATQVAVYTVAFVTMYARTGPIANDPKWLGRVAKVRRLAETRAAIDALISKGKLFLTDDGLLMNGRTARELAATTGRIQKARDNGRLGGRPSGAISSRSRQDHVPISSRSRSKSEAFQRVGKPSGIQPPTTNYQSSLSEAPILSPRASRPAVEGQPARAPSKPDPKLEALAAEARKKFMKGE